MHPQRSVITRALGAGPELEVDTRTSSRCADGDVLLLVLRRPVRPDRRRPRSRACSAAADPSTRRVRAARARRQRRRRRRQRDRRRLPDRRGDARRGPPAERPRRWTTATSRTRSPRPTPCRRSGCRRPSRCSAEPRALAPARLGAIVAFTTFVLLVAALAVGAVGGLAGRTSSASTRRPAASPCTRACRSSSTGPPPVPARLAQLGAWPRRCRAAERERAVRPHAALVERRRAHPATARSRPSPDAGAPRHAPATASSSTCSSSPCSPWPASRRSSWRARARSRRRRSSYAGVFLALFVVAHIALRMRLPQADPYLLPLVGILASVGLCEIYRIRPALARDQALWMRDRRRGLRRRAGAAARLPRARALPLPVRRARARPARGHDPVVLRDRHRDQRRARLDPRRRPLVPAGRAREGPARRCSSPATCASAASCWRRRPRRVLGHRAAAAAAARAAARRCSARALLLLVAMNDFGTSLLFFGVFVALVYVATGRSRMP